MRILLIVLVVGLAACNEGGSTGANNSGGGDPVDGPVKAGIQWGDLHCQKARTCEQPLLNLSAEEISKLHGDFAEASQVFVDQGDDKRNEFACGANFQKIWSDNVGPMSELESQEFGKLVSGLADLIDFKRCEFRPDYKEQLLTLLKKENENE